MIGRVVGKYKILSQIAEGGMGIVYRAEHIVLGSPAAVKILLPQFTQDRGVVDRFFQEAKAASAIRHPGIVEVFDFGRLPGGQAYIAMELLRGEDLSGFLARRGTLEGPLAVRIGIEVLAALNATHVVGVVHRDLKPDNIFLVRDAGAPGGIRVKILDFGIAKLICDPLSSPRGPRGPRPQTRVDTILGTPAYMAPEQCKGGARPDARIDLYAVGCILFELLTGRPPFVAAGDGEVMAMHIYEPPPRLSNRVRGLPVELEAVLARLLVKNPDDRIPSAAYALAELERVPLPPLTGEVPLSGAHPMLGGATPPPRPEAVVSLGEPPPLPMPRWIPVIVLGGALLIAIAVAYVIGVT
ncbi:MAG TPA: serine/threonine-protein kinase [Kofleriaceae bacterium]|nr:serine/threonine-protein kinase [Kofleriaceae bacterium]